jgi:hypothetical protein
MPHFVRDNDAQAVVNRFDRHVLECRTPVKNGPVVELEVCNDAGPAAPPYTVLDPRKSSARTFASWLLSGKITRLFHSQGENPGMDNLQSNLAFLPAESSALHRG